MRSHRPGRGHPVPVSTYRLQLTPDVGFAEVAALADYLADLGITDAYLSPVLEAAPGSTHGYDVTSHARLSLEKGGRPAFEAMSARLRESGIRVVVDVVPNHMTIPTPMSRNAQFWSVLRDGRDSPHAHWFDIDWYTQHHHLLLPVLGGPIEEVLARGEITTGQGGPTGTEPVLRYFAHEFPLRPGTEHLSLPDILAAQHYRLSDWREATEGLNYRRFFDVTTLVGVRVEEPDVFYRTHALLLDLIDGGEIAGLRIDHPDGLADPAGYLERLAQATGHAWIVVEKILTGDEALPDWACAGTTGYDALNRVCRLFVDPAAYAPLREAYAATTGDDPDLPSVVARAKADVVAGVLAAEVQRLVRVLHWLLPQRDPPALTRAVEALLDALDCYRIYLPYPTPGSVPADPLSLEELGALTGRAAQTLDPADQPMLADVAAVIRGALPPGARPDQLDARRDVVTRFQQTCGPVLAKGVEDTAFYRYQLLVALAEVGGDPARFGCTPADFHVYCQDRLQHWPLTLTALSTHDTKRSEDARARILAIAEFPDHWPQWLARARRGAAAYRPAGLDASTEYRLWQEAIGAWPISPERLRAYAIKAAREAKTHTSWTTPDAGYESAVAAFAEELASDPGTAALIDEWLHLTNAPVRSITLGQKLIQLTMPGVADSYQGSEMLDRSLVDPDNRRPVDHAAHRAALARLDAGNSPRDLGDEKLLVTSRALRVRRDRAECFVGPAATYLPLLPGEPNAIAFARGDDTGPAVIAVATRLTRSLQTHGGWGETTLALPAGSWRNVLGADRDHRGSVPVGELLNGLPVALLVAAAQGQGRMGEGSPTRKGRR